MTSTTVQRKIAHYSAQLKAARRVLADEGLEALHNPHAMIGEQCECGSCFTCAAAEVYAEANARLIKAAPDLLVALENLRTQLRHAIKLDVKKHYSLMVADAAAGAAITKATAA